MSVVITRDDIIAYAEVDYIIHHMNEKYVEKVPTKLLQFFATIKDPEHEIYVDPRVPLQNQNLKKYTLELLALLHLKYWCEDEERRKELYEKMVENQQKLDEQMREKYNIDNMFELNSAKVVNSETDLQEDFSKPKNITKYDTMAEENPDMQDYTDVQEDKLASYLNTEKKQIEELEKKEMAVTQKMGIITSIISRIKAIFVKQK
ncbi:MAG: hypothetical protein J6A36_02185 [Clostridia bacterium]|nr:hypothetical protein [Clostridia bacterium]